MSPYIEILVRSALSPLKMHIAGAARRSDRQIEVAQTPRT